jgi:uncharacterized membrane protein
MVISQREHMILFFTTGMVNLFSASLICILFILPFTMFYCFLLDSFNGILRSSMQFKRVIKGYANMFPNQSSIIIIFTLTLLQLSLSISF